MKTMDRFVNIDTPQRYKELIEEVLQELKFVIPYHADTFKMCKATGYYGRCKQRGSRFYIYLSQYLDNCTDQQIKEVIAPPKLKIPLNKATIPFLNLRKNFPKGPW